MPPEIYTIIAVGIVLAGNAAHGNVSASLSGVVRGPDGAAVEGARDSIVHRPSGTEAQALTLDNGAFFQGGLRVGGPFDIAFRATGFREARIAGVTLRPGAQSPLAVVLEYAAEEEIVVTAPARPAHDLNNGVGSAYTSFDISRQPAVHRDAIRTLLTDPGDAAADWGYGRRAFFVQDAWAVSPELELTGGVRYERLAQGDAPAYSDAVFAAYGFGLDFSASYARQDVEAVAEGTSARGISNWLALTVTDRNAPDARRSPHQTTHSWKLRLGYERAAGPLNARLDIFGRVFSGRLFTYTFDVDRGNALFGRAGAGEGPFDAEPRTIASRSRSVYRIRLGLRFEF